MEKYLLSCEATSNYNSSIVLSIPFYIQSNFTVPDYQFSGTRFQNSVELLHKPNLKCKNTSKHRLFLLLRHSFFPAFRCTFSTLLSLCYPLAFPHSIFVLPHLLMPFFVLLSFLVSFLFSVLVSLLSLLFVFPSSSFWTNELLAELLHGFKPFFHL